MPQAAHRRHDISDKVWEKPEPFLPGRPGSWGGIAHDTEGLSIKNNGRKALYKAWHLVETAFVHLK